MNITVNAYQDTRKKNKQDIYPVSLVIYDGKKQRRCPVLYNDIVLRLSPADYQASQSKRPKDKDRVYTTIIQANIERAYEIIRNISPFSFDKFLAEFTGVAKNKTDIITAYNELVADAEKEKSLSVKTVKGYRSALASLLQFFEYKDGKKPAELHYSDITPHLLKQYEHFIVNIEIVKDGKTIKRKGSLTTVSMYLRTLRAVFNAAIDSRYIKPELMPFGRAKSKYTIPAPRKSKRALTSAQVAALFNYDYSQHPARKKARDFWFMSFFGQGMNINDILKLKYKTVTDTAFTFVRSKTNTTNKKNAAPVTVMINEFIRYMFKTYGNPDKSPENYVFPVLNDTMTDKEIVRAIDNFTVSVNKRLKPVAKILDLPPDFSTYYARHTYATTLLRSGKSVAFIQKSIGHSSVHVTELYLSGFENSDLQDANDMLYDMVSGAGG